MDFGLAADQQPGSAGIDTFFDQGSARRDFFRGMRLQLTRFIIGNRRDQVIAIEDILCVNRYALFSGRREHSQGGAQRASNTLTARSEP